MVQLLAERPATAIEIVDGTSWVGGIEGDRRLEVTRDSAACREEPYMDFSGC